jgi:hypothetical protein
MTWRRRLTVIGVLAVLLLVLAYPPAGAEFRGSDVVGNISPDSQVAGDTRYYDRLPLSRYALDYDVDTTNDGLIDTPRFSAIPALIAQFLAAQIWEFTKFLVNGVIDLFTWAFSLDLLQGDPNTPGDGALAPVADAISSIYQNVFGREWMVAAIVLAGMWGVWKALVQRRYTETAGALTLSVVFVLIALFFVNQPEKTVGTASEWTNKMSLAFLSGVSRGSVDRPEQAKSEVADQLFRTLIYEPWVVLDFGGLRHCVDTDQRDQDGFPEPVSPHDPRADVCRDHMRRGADGFGGYAERFLRQEPGSDARKREYEAIKDGSLPEAADERDPLKATPPPVGTGSGSSSDQFQGYRVDRADAPAVDIQQQGGAFQRVVVSLIVFVGALGAIVLLGFLSLAVILVQVLALVLLAFAPVALVIGIFPGRGHDLFRSWLAKLATAIVIKAIYSLVIAIVLAVSAALVASTGRLGFLFAFAIQTLFFWAIFIYRKQISGRLVAATVGEQPDGARLPRVAAAYYGARAALSPVRTARDAGRRRRAGERDERRTRALEGIAGALPVAAGAGTAGGGRGSGGGGAAGGPGRGGGEPPKPPPVRGPGGPGGNGSSPNGDRPTPTVPSGGHPGGPSAAELGQRRNEHETSGGDSSGRRHEPVVRERRDGPPSAGGEHGALTPRERHERTMRRIRAQIERERRTAAPPVGRPREEGP